VLYWSESLDWNTITCRVERPKKHLKEAILRNLLNFDLKSYLTLLY